MSTVTVLVIFAIVLVLIVFGIVCIFFPYSEKFTPEVCPDGGNLISQNALLGEPWRKPFVTKLKNGKVIGSQSPGSLFQCDDIENCPNLNIKGCAKTKPHVDVRENLPLGWGSTMTGSYAGNNCMSNVNGINMPSMKNPYGKVDGDQMYGFCEKGTPNAFA